MGTCLSPLLANLFVSILETSIVDKLKRKGGIITWFRYVNDVFAVVKTPSKETITKEINSWDHYLKFTQEDMKNDELIFLDMRIFYKNQKLQFIKYRKEGLNTVLSNLNYSIMCKKYLKNSIFYYAAQITSVL